MGAVLAKRQTLRASQPKKKAKNKIGGRKGRYMKEGGWSGLAAGFALKSNAKSCE